MVGTSSGWRRSPTSTICMARSSHDKTADDRQRAMMRSLKVLVFGLIAVSVWGASAAVAQVPSAARGTSEISSAKTRTSNPGAPANFTGHAQVEQLFSAHGANRISGGVVTFQPGARSAWRTHPLGQILIISAGTGLVQQWGGPICSMKAGDVVSIPPEVKHWHGAAPGSSVTQMAIQEVLDGKNVDWLDAVTGEQDSGGVPKVSQ